MKRLVEGQVHEKIDRSPSQRYHSRSKCSHVPISHAVHPVCLTHVHVEEEPHPPHSIRTSSLDPRNDGSRVPEHRRRRSARSRFTHVAAIGFHARSHLTRSRFGSRAWIGCCRQRNAHWCQAGSSVKTYPHRTQLHTRPSHLPVILRLRCIHLPKRIDFKFNPFVALEFQSWNVKNWKWRKRTRSTVIIIWLI